MTEFERKIDHKLILSIIAAGIMSFSGVVVETAMNVTFPTLMKEFQVGTSTVQWITTVNLLDWRMIFVVLLPLLILSLFFGLSSIRQVSATEKLAFGWQDYLLLVLGFAAMIFGINLASSYGWISLPVLLLLAVSAASLVLFYRRSLCSKSPLIRVQVFRYTPFSLSVMVILLVQFICLGMGFLIPNYAQLASGENAFISGCLLLPGCIVGAVLSPFGGKLLDRVGAKTPILTGNVSVIVSAVCFALFLGKSGLLMITGFDIFFALGQAFSMGTTMTNGLSALPQELTSDGNAVINTVQQLAGAIGTAVCSTIVAASQASAHTMAAGTTTGTIHAFLLLAALAILTLGCSSGVFYSQARKLPAGAIESR